MATKTKPRRAVESALNNTSTPAGIAANDPDVLDDAGETFARREALANEDLSALPAVELGRRHVNGTGKAAQAAAKESLKNALELSPISPELLSPSPTNPRKHFDPAALQSLAESIRKVGVLEPLLVRKTGDLAYELIAGERRWRAAKLAKLRAVPCRVLDVTDEEALEIQARENIDRDDLNVIERAVMWQQLLEKCGWTQEVLAKRFGISQENISNTIRLLKLPDVWRQRLISQEITPAHARELLAWADVAGLPEKIDGLVKEGKIGSVADFRDDVIEAAIAASRSIDPDGYDSPRCHFRPSKQQLAELDVREVKERWSNRKTRRAFNLEKWNEFNAAAKKKKREAAKKNPKPKRSSGGWDSEKYARERKRAEFGKALYLEKANTIAGAIGERLDPEKHQHLALRALLALYHSSEDSLNQAIIDLLGFKGDWQHTNSAKVLGALVGLRAATLVTLPFEVARRALAAQSENHWSAPGSPELHAWLCKELKIEFAKEWRPSVEFIELFEGDDRQGLLSQGEFVCDHAAKAEAVLTAWPAGFIPRELLLVDEKGKIPAAGKKPKKAKK